VPAAWNGQGSRLAPKHRLAPRPLGFAALNPTYVNQTFLPAIAAYGTLAAFEGIVPFIAEPAV